MPTDVSDDLSKHPVGTGLSDLVKTLTPYPIPVILGLISRVTLLFTLQCQAAIVHRGPLHFTMVEVAENHHRIEAQDQNFRLVH